MSKPKVSNTGASDNPGTEVGAHTARTEMEVGPVKYRWKNQGNQAGEMHAGSWQGTLRMPRQREKKKI